MDTTKHHKIKFSLPTSASPEELIKKLKDLYKAEATLDMEKGSLSIDYDLKKCKEEFIEMTLVECGFELDDSLMQRIKRNLTKFKEENELDNIHSHPTCCNDMSKIERNIKK